MLAYVGPQLQGGQKCALCISQGKIFNNCPDDVKYQVGEFERFKSFTGGGHLLEYRQSSGSRYIRRRPAVRHSRRVEVAVSQIAVPRCLTRLAGWRLARGPRLTTPRRWMLLLVDGVVRAALIHFHIYLRRVGIM